MSHARPIRRSALVRTFGILAVVAVATLGCSDDGDGASTTSTTVKASYDPAVAKAVVAHYADGVYHAYDISLRSAKVVQQAVDAFVESPSDQTLAAARSAWIEARTPYGQTEAFRFYGGPIDDEKDGPEARINGWPLDEQYIDYTQDSPDSGIVNDPKGYPEITKKVLADANEKGGEANLSTGWHAIEFLLWGQDLSTDGPGDRPVTDYTTGKNADRRKEYLKAVTDLLVDDLTTVTDAWKPDADNYRADFLKQDPATSLTDMITGMGELSRGELAGERMNVAYEERDQENEHSCFSDNTTNDLIANATSVANVWQGNFQGAGQGPGLVSLVTVADAELAAKITQQINESVAEIGKIPAPFDQHLNADAPDDGPGRTAIKTAIDDLGAQTESLVAAAKALGLKVEVS